MADLDRLAAREVRLTVDRLEERIAARFPGRGIGRLVVRLGALVDDVDTSAPDRNRRQRQARLASRVVAALVLVATVVAMGLALRDALDHGVERTVDWLPLIESTINDLVFAAIALFFLYSIPERLQRGRSLALLHRLRSLAHVVDMHQLTKDPERFRPDFVATARSVDPRLTPAEMERYLDYCSEILSLVGKTAALVAEESRDAVVLDAVAGIENLTTSMSRKIWQKITLLSRL
ncbi:hypothetical protein [Nocardioides rubriscoriae]|uniref:hypothetical protein n=1 Tax=Nocardioides rubriscoriae TaxID=642762 RepID=UPI0011E04A11|nr:hypothetical protein [Nocardioides rubriscoriae]